MNIISLPRGNGKTTQLIKISAETGMPILTISKQRAVFIFDRAKELKKQLIIKTTNSTHTKMTIWAVVLLIVFISWLINNQSGIIVSVFSFILGWRFIYSTDYDSWLEEV